MSRRKKCEFILKNASKSNSIYKCRQYICKPFKSMKDVKGKVIYPIDTGT